MVQDAHKTDSSGSYLRSPDEREVIAEACFMRLFIALEEYFEAAFGHYLMGGVSTSGWAPVAYASPPTLEHGHNMLIGLMRFVDWSTSESVRRLARLYFKDGEPFDSPLASAVSDLQDMKTVRNAAAHVSRTTTAPLDALYRRWTGSPRQGVSAYEMILATGHASGASFLARADAVVSSIGSQIANR